MKTKYPENFENYLLTNIEANFLTFFCFISDSLTVANIWSPGTNSYFSYFFTSIKHFHSRQLRMKMDSVYLGWATPRTKKKGSGRPTASTTMHEHTEG